MPEHHSPIMLSQVQMKKALVYCCGIVYTVTHKTSLLFVILLVVGTNSIYHFQVCCLVLLCIFTVLLIYSFENKLYATHGNLVTGEGTELSVYQMNTGEIATYDLDIWPGQIAIHGNSLYVMGKDQIGKYDLQTLEKQLETNIPLETGYYLSEIFSRSN